MYTIQMTNAEIMVHTDSLGLGDTCIFIAPHTAKQKIVRVN